MKRIIYKSLMAFCLAAGLLFTSLAVHAEENESAKDVQSAAGKPKALISMVSENPVIYGDSTGALAGTRVGPECIARLLYNGQMIADEPFALNSRGMPTGKLKGGLIETDLVPAGETVEFELRVYGKGGSAGESTPFEYTTGVSGDSPKAPDPMLMFDSFTLEYVGAVPPHHINIIMPDSMNVGETLSCICMVEYMMFKEEHECDPIWSIISGNEYATIDKEGVLRAIAPGTVVVGATYTDWWLDVTLTTSSSIEVIATSTPLPIITSQPQSQSVTEGNPVTFIVGVTSGNVINEDKVVLLSSSMDMDMIWIKPGSFIMGSPSGELERGDNEIQHQVVITEGYWLGKYEVTQEQYEAVMGNNPSKFSGNRLPVEKVTWDDAMEFCQKLTEQERSAGRLPAGYEYTLPTEAQWEYACRAGTITELNSGKNLTGEENCPNMNQVGWYVSNSDSTTKTVGQKKPNAWGLYDMHGNVWEWCLDWKGDYSASAVVDPVESNAGTYKTLRGGSWNYTGGYCRSAIRGSLIPTKSNSYTGFRVALSMTGKNSDQTYQWYKDGKVISGATDSSYMISSAKISDTGSYTVTVSNSIGGVASSAATLMMAEDNDSELILEQIEGQWRVIFTGILQESTDTKGWRNVTTQSPYPISIQDGKKFYRSVQ